MRHALAVAIACLLIGLTPGTRLALADTGIPTETVTSLVTDLGGASVTVRIPFPPTYSRVAAGDPFLEFSIPVDLMEQPASFAAYLPVSPRRGVAFLSGVNPISTWDITPADHENGLGGYVRLYLPADIGQFVDSMGILELVVCSTSTSIVDLTSGVGNGQFQFVPTVRQDILR